MRTRNCVIIKVDNSYNNEVELSGGHKLVVNTSIEDVEYINRKATVISAPEFTVLKEGDEIVIHHNILREGYGQQGGLIRSEYWLEDDTFFVPLTEIFAYKRDSEWVSLDPFCFVQPIKFKAEDKEGFQLFNDERNSDSYKGQVKLTGTIAFTNKSLQEQGVENGDVVMFSHWSEYEFTIDGELYYKMSTKDIIAKL